MIDKKLMRQIQPADMDGASGPKNSYVSQGMGPKNV